MDKKIKLYAAIFIISLCASLLSGILSLYLYHQSKYPSTNCYIQDVSSDDYAGDIYFTIDYYYFRNNDTEYQVNATHYEVCDFDNNKCVSKIEEKFVVGQTTKCWYKTNEIDAEFNKILVVTSGAVPILSGISIAFLSIIFAGAGRLLYLRYKQRSYEDPLTNIGYSAYVDDL